MLSPRWKGVKVAPCANIAAGLEECGVFNAEELKRIDRGNTLKILPKWA